MNWIILIWSFLFAFTNSYAQDNKEIVVDGIPPDELTCAIYAKHEDWLPNAFITNAKCACLKIPDDSEANIIRLVLIQRLDSVDLDVKKGAIEMKRSLAEKEISKSKYNRYIKRVITPIIHNDHIIAYSQAGCKADPAPYFGWKQITTREVKNCRLIWFSIRYFGGSCSGKWGRW